MTNTINTIHNYNLISNKVAGTLLNKATFINKGQGYSNIHSVDTSNIIGYIDNSGVVTNETGTLTNKGQIQNSTDSSLLNNYSSLVNDSLLINLGICKVFRNSSITNNEKIQNNLKFINYGTITNNDNFTSMNTSVFDNFNKIENKSTATMSTGTFTNKVLNSTNDDKQANRAMT